MADHDHGSRSDAPAVTPASLAERLRRGEQFTVLDVRDRDEFERWHIEGPHVESVQRPHVRFIQASVTGDVGDLVADLREPIVVVCARGEASADVAAQLQAVGIDAANLAGGMNAWARQYESIELNEATVAAAVDGAGRDSAPLEALPASVWQYDRVASGCLGYLVVDGGVAAVVDPLEAFADRYVADARDRGADLRYAIDTHVHADHVSGVRAVAEATDARPVLPAGATDRGLAFEARLVADGESLPLGATALRARALPGHTSELLGFSLVERNRDPEEPGALWLTGDTVFGNAVARPDLEAQTTGELGGEGGQRDRAVAENGESAERDETEEDRGIGAYARRLYRTIHERLLALPDETVLAPGHRQQLREGPTVVTVGDVRSMDALGLELEAFVERVVSGAGTQPANFEEIVAVNLGRTSVPDRERFELELGPNNCAVG